jgi:hypothetical protein
MKDQWHIGVQKSKLAAWPKRPKGMNHKAEGGIHGASQQGDEDLVKAQHDDTDMAKRRQQTRKDERAHKKSHAVMKAIRPATPVGRPTVLPCKNRAKAIYVSVAATPTHPNRAIVEITIGSISPSRPEISPSQIHVQAFSTLQE